MALKIHYGGGLRIVSGDTVSLRLSMHPACQTQRRIAPPRITTEVLEVTCAHCIALIERLRDTAFQMAKAGPT